MRFRRAPQPAATTETTTESPRGSAWAPLTAGDGDAVVIHAVRAGELSPQQSAA